MWQKPVFNFFLTQELIFKATYGKVLYFPTCTVSFPETHTAHTHAHFTQALS